MKVVIYTGTPTELAEFIARVDDKHNPFRDDEITDENDGDTEAATDGERRSNADAIANLAGILANLVQWHNEHKHID